MDAFYILGGISFLNVVVITKLLVTLLVAPLPILHAGIKAHWEMQYFTPVFTTTCLRGLDLIYYKLGKSGWDVKLSSYQGII